MVAKAAMEIVSLAISHRREGGGTLYAWISGGQLFLVDVADLFRNVVLFKAIWNRDDTIQQVEDVNVLESLPVYQCNAIYRI